MRLICSKFFSSSPAIILWMGFIVLGAIALNPTPANATCACTCVFNKGGGVIPATAIPGYKDEDTCTVACQGTALGNSASGWTYNNSACFPEAAMEAAKAEDKKEAEAKAEASSGSSASGSSSSSSSSSSTEKPKPPPAAPTEKQCECFCSTSSGAKDAGKKSSIECQTECKKGGNMGVAACAYSLAQYPSQSLYCFTDEQCTKQNGDPNLSKQAPECVSGQKYCYPDPSKAAKIKLNVAIGGLTLVGDLATYINTAYSWMLGAGVTIAIVLAMVGGLQYVLSSGGAKVGDAKKRITNALIGLILLLCVNLILQTVNPYLLTMQVPKLPMIKKVILISGASCEDLAKNGYEIKSEGDKICGNLGKVLKDKDGKDVADGTTCDYTVCKNSDKNCVFSGSKRMCMGCLEVLDKTSPSASYCTQLKPPSKHSNEVWDECGYTSDVDVVDYVKFVGTSDVDKEIIQKLKSAVSNIVGSKGKFIGVAGVCAAYDLDCSKIKDCSDYADIKVQSHFGSTTLKNIQSDAGSFGFEKICSGNPCGEGGGRGGHVKGSCVPEAKGVAGAANTWSSYVIPGAILYNIVADKNDIRCSTH